MHNVYIIHNTTNDRVYIGQTVQGRIRFTHHKGYLKKGTHQNRFLQRAWDAYGAGVFEFFMVDSFDSIEEANQAEQFYVAWFASMGLCYNITDGGKSGYEGVRWSEERKQEYSDRLKGKPRTVPLTDEQKRKIKEARANQVMHPRSEETKRKIAEGLKAAYENGRKRSGGRPRKPKD